MELTSNYRHELKYQINYCDYLSLKRRISPIMKHDSHTNSNGLYTIRSIYFDNYQDKALHEKIDGIQKREKFRIRYYNDDLSYIVLEKKIKHNDLCMKISSPLTTEEYHQIIQSPDCWMLTHQQPLINELYYKMKVQLLKPRVIVSYIREPFIYNVGNVRVTFDYHISTSLFQRDFQKEQITNVLATDNPSDMILEIKYDNFLPETIQSLLQTEQLRQQAFSKYGICRRFG